MITSFLLRSYLRAKDHLRNERGAVAIEYGMIAALVCVAIIITVSQVGDELNETFTVVRDELNAANP